MEGKTHEDEGGLVLRNNPEEIRRQTGDSKGLPQKLDLIPKKLYANGVITRMSCCT